MMDIEKGIIKKDCTDEHYLYEYLHYPREGLIKVELKAGDEVEIIKRWWNFDGDKIRVRKGDITIDIKASNIKFINQ